MIQAQPAMRPKALILHGGDSVAIALEPLPAGTVLNLDDGGTPVVVTVLTPIDQAHKVALKAIQPGEPVYKYGQPIGVATKPIAAGEHVHIHNLVGKRGRGDLARPEKRSGGAQ